MDPPWLLKEACAARGVPKAASTSAGWARHGSSRDVLWLVECGLVGFLGQCVCDTTYMIESCVY